MGRASLPVLAALVVATSAGAARIVGTDDRDGLHGTSGSDVLVARGGNDLVYAGRGDDRAAGGTGRDWIDGGLGDDLLFGGPGVDYVYGGPGADHLLGGAGADGLHGNAGNDLIDARDPPRRALADCIPPCWRPDVPEGADVVDGGDGNDRILAVDRRTDVIRCREGRDVVVADPADRISPFGDCEIVGTR